MVSPLLTYVNLYEVSCERSHRYEHGSTLITTDRVYKQWATIFNSDAVLTSALLGRLLHHVETVRIEGKSYRAQGQVEI